LPCAVPTTANSLLVAVTMVKLYCVPATKPRGRLVLFVILTHALSPLGIVRLGVVPVVSDDNQIAVMFAALLSMRPAAMTIVEVPAFVTLMYT